MKNINNHKSVKLTSAEKTKFKRKVKSYPSYDIAAKEMGLTNRDTVARVMGSGSGRQSTIDIIRKAIAA